MTACGTGGAFLAQKIAVPQPHHFAAAEKRQGLQGLPQSAEHGQRLAAVAHAAFDDLVIHAAHFRRPVGEKLFGALFDGEIVVAINQRQRMGLRAGHFSPFPNPRPLRSSY